MADQGHGDARPPRRPPPGIRPFGRGKPPLPPLVVDFYLGLKDHDPELLELHEDAISEVDMELVGHELDPNLCRQFLSPLSEAMIHNVEKDLEELFTSILMDDFDEHSCSFLTDARMSEEKAIEFIKNFESIAEKQGLEVVEIYGREALLGDEYSDYAASDVLVKRDDADEDVPSEEGVLDKKEVALNNGVLFYFKAPSGMVASLYIGKSDEMKGCYRIVSDISYGVLPSHPWNRTSEEEKEAMINARVRPLEAACYQRFEDATEKTAEAEIEKQVAEGLLKEENRDAAFRALYAAKLKDQTPLVEEFLHAETERIEKEVYAELGSGDEHAANISMDEIGESLRLMQKMQAATRETLIGLDIFAVPRDRTPRRRGGERGDDGDDFSIA